MPGRTTLIHLRLLSFPRHVGSREFLRDLVLSRLYKYR